MDGFTPSFLLQVIIAIGSGGLAYGVMRADLRNLMRSMDEERRIREEHEIEDDEIHASIRGDIVDVSNRISRIEGANDLTERLAAVLKRG